MKSIISQSSEQTQQIARDFSRDLKGGSIICLYGGLGAGKTTFVQGVAKSLGVRNRIISPTFIIVRKYKLKNDKTFYHIDLYRIENEQGLEGLGIEEILSDKDAIVTIEWAERLGSKLPKERTDIYFENIDDDKRQIVISQKSRPKDDQPLAEKVESRKLNSKLKISEKEMQNAVRVFNSGGVVIFPTDTAVGIGCRMDDEDAVRKVYEIKDRDYSKSLLVLVDSIEMAQNYVEISDEVREKLLAKYWPGGLTVVFKCKKGMVNNLVNSENDTLALRLPNHKEILGVIGKVGVPIIATSANISGRETPYKMSEVDEDLKSKVDFVMDGECTYETQSTIIDTTVNPWKIIREGAVKIDL